MDRIILSLIALFALCANKVSAQITVAEPEFAEQVLLVTDNAHGTLLPKEAASIKTKAGASLYLVGIGKVKSRLTLEGAESSVTAKAGTVYLIVGAKDNTTDPESFIDICKFEVKSKRRQYQIAEDGTFSAAKTNSTSSVDFSAKKYGKSSYLIQINNATEGQYGILIGNPDSDTQKNNLKISTFGVK